MRLSILTTTVVVEIGIDTARFDKLQSRTKVVGKVEQLNSIIRPFQTLYISIFKNRLFALFLKTPSSLYSMLGQIRIITHKNKFSFVQHWFRGRGEQGEQGEGSDNFPNIIDDDCSCHSERAMWIQWRISIWRKCPLTGLTAWAQHETVCASAKKNQLCENNKDETAIRECQHFIDLFEAEWTIKISFRSLTSLGSKKQTKNINYVECAS